MGQDENNDPGTMARAALEMFKIQRGETDKQIQAIREVSIEADRRTGIDQGADVKSRVEAAVLAAESNRELATAVIAATEIVDSSIKQMNGTVIELNRQIQDFTKKADEGTNRLAKWTLWLAIATGALVFAAAAQTWVLWTAEPMQVIAIPSPPPE
ncbi:MAG: hypothetical protein Q7R30_17895 [Acidobacteriota bacterium]|nr:hypothetical protein [Acidobacteriota bacterium]